MIKRIRGSVLLPCIAAMVALSHGAVAFAATKAKVSLLPSVESVAPGQAFDLAFRFQLESGWHIYWQNSGDSGLPPSVQWTLPSEFTVGEFQYPTPRRHVSPGDIISNVLAGEPVLLVKVTPPASVAESAVKFGAAVSYLICEKTCLREDATLSLELPVQSSGPAKPANAEVFDRARRNMPKANSKYVTVTPSLKPEQLSPETKFELILTIDIAKEHHIQSNKPSMPTLIPSDLFVERQEGIRLSRPIFPEGNIRPDKFLGKLSEYDGRITVRVPGEVDVSRKAGSARFAGVFTYQACDEKGHCFQPDAVSFAVTGGSAEGISTEDGAVAAGTLGTQPPSSTSAASVAPVAQATASDVAPKDFFGRFGIIGLFVACFLYGLFINATPCVLPLLSIKVLGFVEQARESRRRTLALGLAFGAGVLVFFVVLGFLAANGKNVLHFPSAVIGLSAVVLAMALSLLGVFTLQVPAAAVTLESHLHREGLLASFGKGALAPVLGFACTGPFLAAQWGWATQQPPLIALFAFLFAGLGMASPYVLLGANPNWLSFLPKPGQWMITFERIMGFLLLVMVVWFLHPLITQIGVTGLEWTLAFLVMIGIGCYLLGKVDYTMTEGRRWCYRGGAGAIVLLAGAFIYGWAYPLGPAAEKAKAASLDAFRCGEIMRGSEIAWQQWSAEAVESAVQSGKVVFVDFTAAYCTVCKSNKYAAIDTTEVIDRLKALQAAAFVGDFTTGDEAIFAELQRHGRAGVPLNLIYPPGKPDAPIVLDPNLTKSYLLEKLDEAAVLRSASSASVGS